MCVWFWRDAMVFLNILLSFMKFNRWKHDRTQFTLFVHSIRGIHDVSEMLENQTKTKTKACFCAVDLCYYSSFSVNQIFHFFGVANRRIDTYGIGIEFRASHLISHTALVAATYCCITTVVVVRATIAVITTI